MPVSTKLNKATIAVIVKGVTDGLPLSSAASLAGISYRTLRRWQKLGEDDLENNTDTLHAEFAKELRVAVAEGELALVLKLRDAKGVQGIIFLLSRSPLYKGNYRQEVELTEAELLKIIERMKKEQSNE